MKKLIVIIVIALASIQFGCECEEDSELQSTSSIEGVWIGHYTADDLPNLGKQYSCYIIKPDGTLINDTEGGGKQHFNVGTWTLSGDSFSATTTCVYGLPANIGIVQNHSATFNKTEGTLTNGIWRNVPPKTAQGKFTVTKVE